MKPHLSDKYRVVAIALALLIFSLRPCPVHAVVDTSIEASITIQNLIDNQNLLGEKGKKLLVEVFIEGGQPFSTYLAKIQAMSDDLSAEENQALHDELAQTTSEDFTVEVLTENNLSDIFQVDSEDTIRQQAQQAQDDNYELAITLASIVTVSKDGYYRFRIDIPDELVGQKVSELKLYASEVNAGGDVRASADPLTIAWTVLDLETFKITDTLKDSVMLATMLPIEKSLLLSIGKLILMVLAGGCEADTWGSVTLFSVLAAAIFFMKHRKKYLPR